MKAPPWMNKDEANAWKIGFEMGQEHVPGEPQEAPDNRAISEAYSDWAWEKEGTAVGLMLPSDSARAGFFAGVKWLLSKSQGAPK